MGGGRRTTDIIFWIDPFWILIRHASKKITSSKSLCPTSTSKIEGVSRVALHEGWRQQHPHALLHLFNHIRWHPCRTEASTSGKMRRNRKFVHIYAFPAATWMRKRGRTKHSTNIIWWWWKLWCPGVIIDQWQQHSTTTTTPPGCDAFIVLCRHHEIQI